MHIWLAIAAIDFSVSNYYLHHKNFIYLIFVGCYSRQKFFTSENSTSYGTLTLYAFLWRLILHVINYTIITYGYFNIQSRDKDHSIQYEMAF